MVESEATAPAGTSTAGNAIRMTTIAKNAAVASATTNTMIARAPNAFAESPVAPAVAARVRTSASGSATIWSAEIQRSPTAVASVGIGPRGAADPCAATPNANPAAIATRDHVVKDRNFNADRSGAVGVAMPIRSFGPANPARTESAGSA